MSVLQDGRLVSLSDSQLKAIVRSSEASTEAKVAAVKVLAARRALRKVAKNTHVHPRVRAAARAALKRMVS